MLLITNFLIGFAVIFGILFLVGITRGNKISQKTWVILWSIISSAFALFLVFSTILENEVILNYALGGSLGYVTAVSIHTLDHALKEVRKNKQSLKEIFDGNLFSVFLPMLIFYN